MPGDSRPLATRRGPPLPAAIRPPSGMAGWLGALALLGAMTLSACDDGDGASGVDRGSADAAADASGADARRPDAMSPDAAVDAMSPDAAVGATSPDATSPDAAPDAATPLQAASPAVTAGGATVESGRYRLRLSVGGPSPTHVTSSDRLQARIGAALPLPHTEERP